MKKYLIYLGILLIGLFCGWLIFGLESRGENYGRDTSAKKEQIWTCSMHPQIRQSEPGDCPICGMDLIPFEENNSQNPLVFTMSDDAVMLANIQTTVVGDGKDANSPGLSLSGRIEVDETTASSIVTHIPGRIEKLYIGFTGERVSKGQRVAQIYSAEYITAQRELLEAFKVRDDYPNLLEAAKNKLRYWKIDNDQITRILKNQRVNEYLDIRSEHSGIVARKRVSVGDHLGQGQALFDLQNLNKLWAVFDAYESQLSDIQIGDKITFTTPALGSEEFTSTVSFIDPVIDPNSRTARVRMEIGNPKGLLKPDMFISGNLVGKQISKQSKNVPLLVPKSAVMWTGERSVVYVKLPELSAPSFEYREVTLNGASGDSYIVSSGIESGEEVVTNGAFVIDASAQLNNQASMMNRHLATSKKSTKASSQKKFEVAEAIKKQLSMVTKKYLLIKDALVNDNSDEAKVRAKEMSSQLEVVDMKLLMGDSHMFWMKKIKSMKSSLSIISESDKIKKQREGFDQLSQDFIKVVQAFGASYSDLYVQECTMAFNGKGATWLSSEKEIFNPYYGDEMLNCGSVIDSIKKEKSEQTDHSGHVH